MLDGQGKGGADERVQGVGGDATAAGKGERVVGCTTGGKECEVLVCGLEGSDDRAGQQQAYRGGVLATQQADTAQGRKCCGCTCCALCCKCRGTELCDCCVHRCPPTSAHLLGCLRCAIPLQLTRTNRSSYTMESGTCMRMARRTSGGNVAAMAIAESGGRVVGEKTLIECRSQSR